MSQQPTLCPEETLLHPWILLMSLRPPDSPAGHSIANPNPNSNPNPNPIVVTDHVMSGIYICASHTTNVYY